MALPPLKPWLVGYTNKKSRQPLFDERLPALDWSGRRLDA